MADADDAQVLTRAVAALGGDDRPGQRKLSSAIAAAIRNGHHLVAEAPTGRVAKPKMCAKKSGSSR